MRGQKASRFMFVFLCINIQDCIRYCQVLKMENTFWKLIYLGLGRTLLFRLDGRGLWLNSLLLDIWPFRSKVFSKLFINLISNKLFMISKNIIYSMNKIKSKGVRTETPCCLVFYITMNKELWIMNDKYLAQLSLIFK